MMEAGSCQYSDMACFSLHPVKTMTMGEGGVVNTNDDALAQNMRLYRSHGLTRDPEDFMQREMAFDEGEGNPWYYEMARPGYNYRATDIACALGLSQLGQLDHFIDRRKRLKHAYDRLFAEFDGPVEPVLTRQDCDPCRHLYPVLIDFKAIGKTRREVMQGLYDNGVGTQVHYIPIHHQPYYRDLNPKLSLPGADSYYARVLSLPLFPLMEDGDPDRVVEALRKVIHGG